CRTWACDGKRFDSNPVLTGVEMTKELIANVEPYETRVAVLDEGALINLFIERGDPLAGNIYKGRVANVLPGMEAAFVDIGLERNAFLHVGDIRSKRLADDVEFLLQMWNRVEERSRASRAPALVYQDLRLIRRVVRDQFTEEVSRFLIDSPEEHHRVGDLLNSFAPKLKSRLQLYQGPEPIFEHPGVERDLEEVLRMPCPYCEGRGRVFSPETMGMKVRRELRKVMTTTRAAAILADVHPDVHVFLFREGEGWVRHLEQQTGRRLRVRAGEGMHIERLRVAEGPSLEELER